MNIEAVLKAIDTKDIEGFISFLTEDCKFKFCNLEPVIGKDNIRNFVAGFAETVKAFRHDVKESWEISETIACHGIVSYTRKDDSILSVPFATIFKLDRHRIAEYLIFADTSEL